METLLSPTMDFIFKRIFGSEDNREVLTDFLNGVFEDSGQPRVTHVELLNPFLDKDQGDDKLGIVDVRARTETGTLLNIEIQVAPDPDFDRRSLYYWAKLYTEQIIEGQPYSELHPTITINILDFVMRPESSVHTVFELRERLSGKNFSDALSLHFLELPKFRRQPSTIDSRLTQWLLFLTLHTHDQLEGLAMHDPLVKKAVTNLEWLSQDRETRELYEARQKVLRDELSRIEGALRKGREEGRELGREEGRELGREEGRELGREEGRELGREEGVRIHALTTAQKMLAAGIPIAQICELVGLTPAEMTHLLDGTETR